MCTDLILIYFCIITLGHRSVNKDYVTLAGTVYMTIFIFIFFNIQANILDKIACALKLSWGTKVIGNSWQQHFLRVSWILSESCCQYRGGVSYLFFKYIYTFQYGATIVLTHKRKLSPSNCNNNEIHQMTEQMSHYYGRFSVICLILEGNL